MDAGGTYDEGTLFRITPNGAFQTISSFHPHQGCQDGFYLKGRLVQATNGDIYGTTAFGGNNDGFGTVFMLAVGLSPFVEVLPASGQTGESVAIPGSNLAGASGVRFNGTPAAWKALSSTEITTQVPADATTSKVAVVIPSGTLTSNVAFRVLQ